MKQQPPGRKTAAACCLAMAVGVRPGRERDTATTTPRSSGRSNLHVLCRAGSGCAPYKSDPPSDERRRSQCRRPPRAIPRNLADAVVRPRCPRVPGCLRRSGHKRLEGVWSSPVVVPIERKDRGGHPTGRRDLDEDRVWCQRSDRARWLSHDRGFGDVLHLAPNALDCGGQRGPGCSCPDGR